MKFSSITETKTVNPVLQRTALSLVCVIIVTIPLIFGAVHPIILGFYNLVILAGLGGWLLLNQTFWKFQLPSFWIIIPMILIGYLVLQAIPLPGEWMARVSPARAERVNMVNELAGAGQLHYTLSDNGTAGLFRSIFLVGLVLYFLSLRKLLQSYPGYFQQIILCIVLVGFFEAVYGLIQFVNPQVGVLWLPITGRAAHGTIIYTNQYASLLNMIWPLAVASAALSSSDKRYRGEKHGAGRALLPGAPRISPMTSQSILLIFAVATIMLAVLFSLSRGGILAMLLVSALLLVMMPFSRIVKFTAMLTLFCLICGYGMMIGLDTVVSRFATLDQSGAHRLQIYLSSLPMLFDHWLTGVGIGSYSLLSPVYLKGFPENLHYDRVHSEYLELMIEFGIPMAILLFSWIFAGVGKIFVALSRTAKDIKADRANLIVGTAAFCGLAGFLVHGLVDFGWRLPANLVFAVTLLAIAVSSVHQTEKVSCQRSELEG